MMCVVIRVSSDSRQTVARPVVADCQLSKLIPGVSVRQVFSTFLFFFFLFLICLARLHLYLLIRQVAEDAVEYGSRSEVDSCFLDERVVEVLFGDGALAADTDLQGSQLEETYHFSAL